MAKGITSRSHWRARRKISESTRSNRLKLHKEPQNIRLVDETSFQYNEFLTIQEMADAEQSKMADNPNHGIYRGHRLKSPPSSSTSHLKKKIQIGTSRIGEDRGRRSRSQFENFSKEISNHSFKRPQTSPVAILYNIGRRNFKIGRGNLHGSSCSPYHHHPVDQNGPVSAKKAKNRKPRENCHIHPTKSNSYDVCTSQFIPGSN
ncbi:unnamed protein product [Microthlaspi erraticum]|uniref:Uncharacterized protein n=1 Tax=Microthlaspi erraticum TaxID=1685480 RepID=A0A6D2I0I9_9BRAS|nr:unnamed protein product [Microthlaspi erraticum]